MTNPTNEAHDIAQLRLLSKQITTLAYASSDILPPAASVLFCLSAAIKTGDLNVLERFAVACVNHMIQELPIDQKETH